MKRSRPYRLLALLALCLAAPDSSAQRRAPQEASPTISLGGDLLAAAEPQRGRGSQGATRSSGGRSSGVRSSSRSSAGRSSGIQRSSGSSSSRSSGIQRSSRSSSSRSSGIQRSSRSSSSGVQRSSPSRGGSSSRVRSSGTQRTAPVRSTPTRVRGATPQRTPTPSAGRSTTGTRFEPRTAGSRDFGATTSRGSTTTRIDRGSSRGSTLVDGRARDVATPGTGGVRTSGTRGETLRGPVYRSGRATDTSGASADGAATPRTGRERFDRFVRRDSSSGTTRFVRVDGDRRSPVVDLTGAAAPRRTGSSVPRLRVSSEAGDARRGSERFGPRGGSRAPAVERPQSSNYRARAITRDSILERYRAPRDTRAKGADARTPRGSKGAAVGRDRGLLDERGGRRDVRERRARPDDGSRKGSPAAGIDRRRATAELRSLGRKDAKLPAKIDRAARDSARLGDLALRTGINASLALGGAGIGVGFGYYDNDFATPGVQTGFHVGYRNNCNWWFGVGSWSFGNAFYVWYPWTGLYYPWRYCSSPFWGGYRSCWYGGFPLYYSSLYAGYWGGGYSNYRGAAYEYEEGYDDGFDSGYERGLVASGGGYELVEGEGVIVGDGAAPQGEAPVAAGPIPSTSAIDQEALSRAAAHYLSVGDRAFTEARYGDAVHFYAKAIEFAPDEGVLYLILSDALFATGDYHYAAYSLRKALELDPTLVGSITDKHAFYSDPKEFDRQLAVLETFLQDHYVDDDARLLLAANYLFGNRPATAVDLLESSFSKAVAESPAGQLILSAAKSIQYGTPAAD